MIKSFFPSAHIAKDFIPSGVSDVIQTAKEDDILFINSRSQEHLLSLLKDYLPKEFRGLIIAPHSLEGEEVNWVLLSPKEISLKRRELIDHFYPLSGKMPPLLGVTGTNGKTSVCWFFSQLMKSVGKNVLYLGTIGVYLGGKLKEERIITTTPSYLELRKISYRYRADIDYIALEMSSHALVQNRLEDIKLNLSAWTNFSQDHLDFHKTMEEYFLAKLEIKKISLGKIYVLREEKEILEALGDSCHVVDSFKERCEGKYEGPLFQGFNLKNISMAYSLCSAFEKIPQGNISKVEFPPGRFEVIKRRGRIFIVDYAHTPDALEKLLEQVFETFPLQKVYCLFGCGGDRDKLKRSKMGKVVDSTRAEIILTSDNPRTENPHSIIEDIAKGIIKHSFLSFPQREDAIEYAYERSQKGDVIVVAGKGHECYQEVNKKRFHYSDQEVIRNLA